jgi:hypothetical protein
MSQLPGQSLDEKQKEDPTNPESEIESFLGIRMSKTQKWAWFLGLTAVFWTLIYNTTKKK